MNLTLHMIYFFLHQNTNSIISFEQELSQVDADASYCNGSNPENNWNYILGCYSGSTASTSVDDSSSFTLPSDCVEDGTETDAPTASPVASTSSPSTSGTTTTSECADSSLRFKLTWNGRKITRGCDWVANKQTIMRCAADGVAAMCSDTCGTCSTCVDSDLRFKLTWNSKKITRGCTWVANKQTVMRCAVDGITGACSSTCGEC